MTDTTAEPKNSGEAAAGGDPAPPSRATRAMTALEWDRYPDTTTYESSEFVHDGVLFGVYAQAVWHENNKWRWWMEAFNPYPAGHGDEHGKMIDQGFAETADEAKAAAQHAADRIQAKPATTSRGPKRPASGMPSRNWARRWPLPDDMFS